MELVMQYILVLSNDVAIGAYDFISKWNANPICRAVATAGIEAANAGSASALFNMLRNLGGAVGTATLGTIISQLQSLGTVAQ